ncbi:MFS transporter [Pseudomonas sp. 148P]|uniref:MFS transporter n=1 Tax=Pseudomonas ulcerans TaxID=3115852 RepID=A0ABU7HUQ5_9PSED|nr:MULTISPECIES: MFS transporter [unclassified Pseudomonas]MEE1924003.1 MFS transporter [Pseudomonas sp. 147P]MEE1935234.1 MFS transporter [Pseudomonas sp. 148P]
MTPPTSSRNPWLAVAAVALTIFSVVTTEMLPVGLLNPVAEALDTSLGTAGLMLSLPALLAALFAPLVVIGAGGTDRRVILAVLLGLLVLANLASALAPTWHWMLAARVLVGFCIGGTWAIAGGLAIRLVDARSLGLATSIIFGGVAAASVLGVPLGALVGDFAGWRWAFAAMAAFSVAVLVLFLAVVPPLPVNGSATLRQFVEQLGNRALVAGLVLTLLLVVSHFMAFTFVRPLLSSFSGFDGQWIGVLLLGYGIIGNFLSGTRAAHQPARVLTCIALGLLLTPLLFASLGNSNLGGALLLLGWGLAYGGVSVGLMTWVMHAAPRAIEVATALYVAVFNAAIGLGSLLGGTMVDGASLLANLWLAAAIAAAALLLTLGMHRAAKTNAVAGEA